MKNWQIIAAVVLVLISGTLGTLYYVAGTPHYSLYLVRNAVRGGDRATFYQHFDVKKVVSNAIQRELKGIVPAGPGIVSKKANEILIPAAETIISERLEERLADPSKIKQMSMSLEGVEYSGSVAFVTLVDPADGSSTMLMMERMSNRHWKVVDVDLERASVPFSLNEARERGEELVGPQLPTIRKPTY
jgi:hypothetical protein